MQDSRKGVTAAGRPAVGDLCGVGKPTHGASQTRQQRAPSCVGSGHPRTAGVRPAYGAVARQPAQSARRVCLLRVGLSVSDGAGGTGCAGGRGYTLRIPGGFFDGPRNVFYTGGAID